jgi:hypothetical protein
VCLSEPQNLRSSTTTSGAADVHLTSDDIAELDAATPLPAVYPNWYIDSLTDQPVNQALAGPP